MKNIYCTLDTETVGGAAHPTGMYNVGAIIHDRKGEILATTSLLVMEHYDEIATDGYAKKNFPVYAERLKAGEISAIATEREAYEVIKNLCDHYGVRYVMAYNSGFDFCKTCFRDLLDTFEFIDLYLMALETITHKKSYAEYCRENGKRSKNGKTCATSVEAVYGYLHGNPDFEEEHTALSDAMQEMEIFLACQKMHKRYTKNVHAWDAPFEVKCFPKF